MTTTMMKTMMPTTWICEHRDHYFDQSLPRPTITPNTGYPATQARTIVRQVTSPLLWQGRLLLTGQFQQMRESKQRHKTPDCGANLVYLTTGWQIVWPKTTVLQIS